MLHGDAEALRLVAVEDCLLSHITSALGCRLEGERGADLGLGEGNDLVHRSP